MTETQPFDSTEQSIDSAVQKHGFFSGCTFNRKSSLIILLLSVCLLLLFQGCLRNIYYSMISVSIHSVAISPDNTLIAASGSTSQPAAVVWTLSQSFFSRDKIVSLQCGRQHFLYSLVFSPDSKTLAGISSNRQSVTLWDVETGEIKWGYTPPNPRKTFLAGFTSDGKELLVGYQQSGQNKRGGIFVNLLDSQTGEVSRELKSDLEAKELLAMEMCRKNERYAVVINPETRSKEPEKYTILHLNLKDDRFIQQKEVPKQSGDRRGPLICFHPADNNTLAICLADGRFLKWNIKTGEMDEVFVLKRFFQHGDAQAPNTFKITHDGKKIIAGYWMNIVLYDYESGKEIYIFDQKEYPVSEFKLSETDHHAVSFKRSPGSFPKPKDFLIDYWNTDTGEVMKRLRPNW